ncbi:MAG: glycosyltransferase family 4 protein [Bacteroidota bacterium]|nr:glycosyltransferase family 4 protein [Bacteroidota bacterium]
MKILMVLDHEFPADVRVEKEIKTLVAAGHKVELACFTRQGRNGYEEKDGYVIHRKPISTFTYKSSVGCLKFPFYFNFWREYLTSLLANGVYDALHIHDLPLAQVGAEMKKKFGIRFVLDLHENWPALLQVSAHTNTTLGKLLSSDSQWRAYERNYVSKADRVVVVADEMKQRLVSTGIENSFYVVPNTLGKETYAGLTTTTDSHFITLFYAGGLNFHRGVHVVIEAISKLTQYPNIRFRIVGSGKYEEALKAMARNLKVEGKVEFMGWKSQTEVYEILNQSNIALIPHLRNEHTDNTSPNKLFQYMLAGKPVLSSDCRYIKNILDETGAGICYEDTNPEDFASKLKPLLDSPDLRVSMGQKGVAAIRDKYNWENTSRELLRLYKELI